MKLVSTHLENVLNAFTGILTYSAAGSPLKRNSIQSPLDNNRQIYIYTNDLENLYRHTELICNQLCACFLKALFLRYSYQNNSSINILKMPYGYLALR